MHDKNVNDPVTSLPFVGPSQAEKFSRLGINNVDQLLEYLPRDLLDLSNPSPINKISAKFSEKVIIHARVEDVSVIKTPRKHIWMVQGVLRDGAGELAVHWFNQPYLRNFFKKDRKYILYGEYSYDFQARKIALSNPEIFQDAGIFPIYPQTKNLTSKQISRAVRSAVDSGYRLPDLIPSISNSFITKNIHFPSSVEEYKNARKSFIFQKLIIFILANLYLKKESEHSPAYKVNPNRGLVGEFISLLPFELTKDQAKAIEDILDDYNKKYPMNRLIQGDVGSGKTVVALIAALMAIRSGYRVVWLAPTNILAAQHVATVEKFLKTMKSIKIKVALITSQTKRQKDNKHQITADLLIGTHALLQKDMKLEEVGLVIIDEQHRFGVDQRSALFNQKTIPHLLSLSATPIPRTLAHIIFGNLDISTIQMKPVGRIGVKTYLVPEAKRADSYKFIDSLIEKGQQAFVICPLIENKTSDDVLFEVDDRKTVANELAKLQKGVLSHRRIAALHGKMKPTEKEEIMANMQDGEIDVLVSTSVVEVGVDVPRATVMMIENAEMFGLSQLHQFRGRVGRNDLQSYCLLFSQNLENEKTRDRLKTFIQNHDGFKLAEMDLRQRGPGAVLGTTQSGFSRFNPLWLENTKLLEDASKKAKELIEKLDTLPELNEKVLAELKTEHLE